MFHLKIFFSAVELISGGVNRSQAQGGKINQKEPKSKSKGTSKVYHANRDQLDIDDLSDQDFELRQTTSSQGPFQAKGSSSENQALHMNSQSQSSKEELENNSSIRFYIHGGTDFYLGSEFAVQLQWGLKQCQTHYIKDKLAPKWSQSLGLIGNADQKIRLNVIDSRKNILEWITLDLKIIRKIYPYHLKVIFREEFMGSRPVLYFSIVREDLPTFSVLDQEIKLVINYDGEHIRNPLQYLVIQQKSVEPSKKEPLAVNLPHFYELDLRKLMTFDKINKNVQNMEVGDFNMVYFIPLETGRKSLIMFKSQLNRKLSACLISVLDWKKLFVHDHELYDQLTTHSNQSALKLTMNPTSGPSEDIERIMSERRQSAIKVIEHRQSFQKVLKQIYYYHEIHTIGKITQIHGEDNLHQGTVKDNNRWRALTKNYILRNNLLNKSIKNIEIVKKTIAQKGETLVSLKRTLAEVQQMNRILREKEKSTLLIDRTITGARKQSLNPLPIEKYKTTEIEMLLFEKQAELEFKKKRNDEMTLRMESVNRIEEDTTEVDLHIVENSKTLLRQQEEVRLMRMMRDQIPKQKQLIARVESLFEHKQLQKQMNQMLRKENEKLRFLRSQRHSELEKVYGLILTEKVKQSKSLTTKYLFDHPRISEAEAELVCLNGYYAKLTGL